MAEAEELPPSEVAFVQWFVGYFKRQPDDRQQDSFVKAAFLVGYMRGRADEKPPADCLQRW